MRSMERKPEFNISRLCAFALLVVFSIVLAGSLLAQDGEDKEDDGKDKVTYRITGDIYHGDKNKFSKPCVLCRKKVFEEIPAYQTIKRENLDKNSARYYFLIEEANKVFRAKIKESLEDLDYDLVVEKGGIKASDKGTKIPDITKEVIEEITG